MSQKKKKPNPVAELRAAMESGELPDELVAMAECVLDDDLDTVSATALVPLAVEDIQDSAPAKLQIVKEGRTVISRLAPMPIR